MVSAAACAAAVLGGRDQLSQHAKKTSLKVVALWQGPGDGAAAAAAAAVHGGRSQISEHAQRV